jgi:hypothetical protein
MYLGDEPSAYGRIEESKEMEASLMSMSRCLSVLSRALARSLWLAMLLCLPVWMPLGHAAPADCAVLLEESRYQPPPTDRQEILEAQRCLERKGFPPVKIDGRLGPLTWAALEAYWKSLEVVAAAPPAAGLGVVYQLSGDDLKALQVGKGVLAGLEKLKNEPYAGEDAFLRAVAAAIKPVAGDPARYVPLVLKHADREPSYSLGERAFNRLRVENVPEAILATLGEIKDLAYPSREAIARAIESRVAGQSSPLAPAERAATESTLPEPMQAATLRRILRQVEETTSFQLSQRALDALAAEPRIGARIPAMLKNLAQLRDIEFPSESLFRNAVLEKARAAAPAEAVLPLEQLEPIVRQARKVHAFDAASRVVWDGGRQGCVLDGLSGVVYGFHPYWRAGVRQNIDFSVLSRVGYHALTFNELGELPRRKHWRTDQAGFIDEARRHGAKVDLVIYQNDGAPGRDDIAAGDHAVSEALAGNIVRAIDERPDRSLLERVRAVTSLGLAARKSMGDGVTLYFDGYPSDDDASRFLLRFIKDLRRKLDAADPAYHLNVVVPQEAIGSGFFTFKYLSQVVSHEVRGSEEYEAHDDIDLFLVLLPEPSTATKKALRQRVEEQFSGEHLYRGIQRRNMLRKVVPVLTPDGGDRRQFEQDVIFLEDNFGGIGLWPLPALRDDDAAGDANRVARMAIDGVRTYYQGDYARPPSKLRNFVCPNRWAFRVAFDILGLLIVGYGLLAILLCQLRRFWEKYAWYFLAVIVLWLGTLLSILFYDPFYSEYARGNGLLILLLIGIVLYVAWMITNRKRLAERP